MKVWIKAQIKALVNDLLRFAAMGFGVLAALFVAASIWRAWVCYDSSVTDLLTERCVAILMLFPGLAVIFAVVAVLLGRAGR